MRVRAGNQRRQILYSWSINTASGEVVGPRYITTRVMKRVRVIPTVAEKKRDRRVSVRVWKPSRDKNFTAFAMRRAFFPVWHNISRYRE